jgi:PAS domain-containing protein
VGQDSSWIHPAPNDGCLHDATERKRDEQARMQLAAIVDSSDDTIISADLNGVIQTWNAAADRERHHTAVLGRLLGEESGNPGKARP